MAYNPNESSIAEREDIYKKQQGPGGQALAAKYGTGTSDPFADTDKAQMEGGRSGYAINHDESTYGGVAARYDPRTGRLLQESSANREADYYRRQAEAASGRGAYQINYGQANQDRSQFQGQMGQAQESRRMQLGAYGQQQQSVDQYRALAAGEGPSLAKALMAQGQNNIRAQQASAASSARGPAAMAMAQQNSAANSAAAGQQLAGQMGAIRAQEQLAAMQGYAQGTQALQGAASGIRGQDYGAAGLYNQSRALSQQGAQAQGQMEANQRALNDAQQMNNERMRAGIFSQGVANNLARRQADMAQNSYDSGRSDAYEKKMSDYAGAAAAAGVMMMSDVNNKQNIQNLSDSLSGKGSLATNFGALGGAIGDKLRASVSSTSGAKKPSKDIVSDDMFNMANAAQNDEPHVRLNTYGMDLNGSVPSDANAQASLASAVSDKSRFQLQDPNAYLNNQAMQMEPATYGNPMSSAYQLDMPRYAVSDENSKRKINLLSAALMKADAEKMAASQGAMYGSPSPVRAESPVQHALQNLNPYAFNYKPGIGENPNQRHVGVMAQDLEKTPVGSTVVRDTPQGKVIDGKGTMMLSLAAAADLQKQVDKLKAEQEAMYGAQPAIQPKGSY